MSDTEEQPAESPEEAFAAIEEVQKKREERMVDEMEEYKEMRKAEKEREEAEIAELKRKRAERLMERAEEEKRLVVQRREEEARRKAEEEERKKKKVEDEEKRKIEKERRRREAEKRKNPKKPNFTIVKREGGEEVLVEEEEGNESTKPPQKSKELLDREKQAALAQRITPLANLDELSTEQLEEMAEQLHNQIRNLISHEYDMEEKYKRMQYDIVEMQERTRSMSKIKKKGGSSVQVDDSYDRMSDRFQNAPPKILVANKYEGNLDRRSWKEKLDCYLKKEDLVDINKQYSEYVEQNIDNLYFAGGL